MKARTRTCNRCSAVLSEDVWKTVSKRCPVCGNVRKRLKTSEMETLYYVLNDLKDSGTCVSAVFLDNNSVSSPRLVIRFTDHYLRWKSLVFPEGFHLVVTGQPDQVPCPVELVYYFGKDESKNDTYLYDALIDVTTRVIQWAREFPKTR